MDRDWKSCKKLSFALLFAASVFTFACTSEKKPPSSSTNTPNSGGGTSTPPATPTSVNIRVNWAANPEVDVNTTGGGYRVYYGKTSNVSIISGTYVDVPYVSGPTAPTTALLTGLTVGTYYVKVVAYSAYNPQGISGGKSSLGSTEVSITVP